MLQRLVDEYWAKQTIETSRRRKKVYGPSASSLAARLLRDDLVAELAADEMLEAAFDSVDKK